MSKPKLVVFDINDTLIKQNTWVQLNVALGMTEDEDEMLWRLNQEGVLPNDEWVKVVNNIYQKRGKATLENVRNAIYEYDYIDGAKQCIADLQEAGVNVALLSGAMNVLVEKVASDLGIKTFRAGAQLYFNPDGSLVKMVYPDEEVPMKVYDLVNICHEVGVELEDVICVGDGANERELFKLTRGITFEGSEVTDVAWKTVPSIKEVAQAILSESAI